MTRIHETAPVRLSDRRQEQQWLGSLRRAVMGRATSTADGSPWGANVVRWSALLGHQRRGADHNLLGAQVVGRDSTTLATNLGKATKHHRGRFTKSVQATGILCSDTVR